MANQPSYNVTFSINHAHLLFAMVTLYSLLKNNSKYYFNVYILHNNCLNNNDVNQAISQYPLNQYKNFKIHLVDVSTVKELQKLEGIEQWTKEIYFKLFLPQLLPNVDKILHLDTDVIIRGNISELLNTNMDGYLCLGSEQLKPCFNGGISLYNLELYRSLNATNILAELSKTKKITEDEAVYTEFKNLIKYCKDKIYMISTNHPQPKNKKALKKIVALHYISKKPWQTYSFKAKYSWWGAKEYLPYLQAFINKKYIVRFLFLKYYILSFSVVLDTIHRVIYKKRGINKSQNFTINKIYKYANIKK